MDSLNAHDWVRLISEIIRAAVQLYITRRKRRC
ncbi:hypothetical protein QFZ67_004865 [Streptomyces sp. V1I1]|nr:hypothetical protein [Streptomyces sp. V1I1]